MTNAALAHLILDLVLDLRHEVHNLRQHGVGDVVNVQIRLDRACCLRLQQRCVLKAHHFTIIDRRTRHLQECLDSGVETRHASLQIHRCIKLHGAQCCDGVCRCNSHVKCGEIALRIEYQRFERRRRLDSGVEVGQVGQDVLHQHTQRLERLGEQRRL